MNELTINNAPELIGNGKIVFQEKNVIAFVRENTWLPRHPDPFGFHFDHGWGNGYIAFKSTDNDDLIINQINVHGDITFNEVENDIRFIGFDTCHASDTLERWSEEKVIKETMRMISQYQEAIKCLCIS